MEKISILDGIAIILGIIGAGISLFVNEHAVLLFAIFLILLSISAKIGSKK